MRKRAGAFSVRCCPANCTHPGQRPHLLHRDTLVRLDPERAEYVRGVFWDGRRDHADDPVLGADSLREYIADVWLPAVAAAAWLESANMRLPPWLSVRGKAVEASPPPKQRRDVRGQTIGKSTHLWSRKCARDLGRPGEEPDQCGEGVGAESAGTGEGGEQGHAPRAPLPWATGNTVGYPSA